jgi:hypothetical protein
VRATHTRRGPIRSPSEPSGIAPSSAATPAIDSPPATWATENPANRVKNSTETVRNMPVPTESTKVTTA